MLPGSRKKITVSSECIIIETNSNHFCEKPATLSCRKFIIILTHKKSWDTLVRSMGIPTFLYNQKKIFILFFCCFSPSLSSFFFQFCCCFFSNLHCFCFICFASISMFEALNIIPVSTSKVWNTDSSTTIIH